MNLNLPIVVLNTDLAPQGLGRFIHMYTYAKQSLTHYIYPIKLVTM